MGGIVWHGYGSAEDYIHNRQMKCFGDKARIIEYINWHYRTSMASCALCGTAIAWVMIRVASNRSVVVSSFLLLGETCDFLRNLPRNRSRTHNQVTLTTSHFRIFSPYFCFEPPIQHRQLLINGRFVLLLHSPHPEKYHQLHRLHRLRLHHTFSHWIHLGHLPPL